MLTEDKKKEVQSQIHELMAEAEKQITVLIESVSTSGALTDIMKLEGNYLLAKMLVTLYFRKEPYAPLTQSYREDLENLSHFI
jgi:hypothetical protein